MQTHWNNAVNEQVCAHVRAHIDIPLSVHPFSHQWGSERGMKWAGSRIERIKVPSRDTTSAASALLFPGCSRFFRRRALSDPVNLKLIEWHRCQILRINPQHRYGTVPYRRCYLPALETGHVKCSFCRNKKTDYMVYIKWRSQLFSTKGTRFFGKVWEVPQYAKITWLFSKHMYL